MEDILTARVPFTAVADEGHGDDGLLSRNLTITQTTRS